MMSVFLSYCREDSEAASRLYRDLTERGIRCWLDKEELLPGQRWRETIEVAIRQSSQFIALLSRHSVTKEGFVQRELRLALDFLTEMPPDRIFLIPARLDSCVPAHQVLRDLHWVDLFPDYNSGLERIMRVLDGYSGNNSIRTEDVETASSRESAVMLPPIAGDRPRRLFTEFPLEEIYSEIRRANERVRMLSTWIYGSKRLIETLTPPLLAGVKIQLLILHPQSPFASFRSGEIGFRDPEHGASRIKSNLREFASWLNENRGAASHAEIRLYDAIPTIIMVDTGYRIIYSPLFRGAVALEGPHIEAQREDEELYLRIERHFLRLWDSAKRYSPLNGESH